MEIVKNALLGFCVILCVATFTYNQPVWAETVTVCTDVKDKAVKPVKDKAGKTKQNCRTMKKHQKLAEKK